MIPLMVILMVALLALIPHVLLKVVTHVPDLLILSEHHLLSQLAHELLLALTALHTVVKHHLCKGLLHLALWKLVIGLGAS